MTLRGPTVSTRLRVARLGEACQGIWGRMGLPVGRHRGRALTGDDPAGADGHGTARRVWVWLVLAWGTIRAMDGLG